MAKTVRITARPPAGFRRAGHLHPASPTDHPAEKFSPAELAALKAEPQLIVQELDAPEKKGDGKK